jgi:excinuclease ABC subunit A
MWGGDDEIRINYQNREGTGQFSYKKRFPGVLEDLKRRYMETQSEGIKDWLEKYMSQKPCEACGGRRLKPEALAVTVGGRNIHEISALSVNDTLKFFEFFVYEGYDGLPPSSFLMKISFLFLARSKRVVYFMTSV